MLCAYAGVAVAGQSDRHVRHANCLALRARDAPSISERCHTEYGAILTPTAAGCAQPVMAVAARGDRHACHVTSSLARQIMTAVS